MAWAECTKSDLINLENAPKGAFFCYISFSEFVFSYIYKNLLGKWRKINIIAKKGEKRLRKYKKVLDMGEGGQML